MKVTISRLWPVSILFFCFYCLYTLVVDSFEVFYQKANETVPLRFLACVELNRIWPNRTEIDLRELRNELYDHFNSSEEYRDKRSSSYQREFKLTLKRTKSGDYLILNRRVCLIAYDQNELEDIRRILTFLPVYRPVLFAMKNDTFDFVQMEDRDDLIDQLIVRKKEHFSDCDQSNGRFLCLTECFRRHFTLSRYFYLSNETERILLHFSESNRTIQENERTCFNWCKRENCKLVQLISMAKPKELKPKEPKEPKTFEAEPALSAFDFWLQVIGLIFSFVSLFFDQFASTATKLTKKLTRSRVRRKKVKVGLFYLNQAIIILSLAYCGYLCVQVALEWQAEANDLLEREMTRNLIYPKIVHLVICVGIKRDDYEGKTILGIERATDGMLDDVLESIHVSDGGRSFRTDYQVHRKILFFGYKRCFPLSIHPNYQIIIRSRPILTVRFKKYVFYRLYVLSEEENLNGKSFEYKEFVFQQRIVKRLKSRGCVDYKAKYGNCTGRQNCVERCIARKFMDRYKRTTFKICYENLVIDRDWFSLLEWNTSKLMDPNENLYLNYSRECEEKFPQKECDEIKFERTVPIKQPDDQTIEIDLQFDVVQSVEELPYSLRMALDLLGIQSIFFGFTLLQLFWLVYQFTKPSWRWRLRKKTEKVIWFVVCLLASIGCSWTTVRMLDGIVNGELVPTEHYKLSERVQMPAIVFCLRIDQKLVDRNHQLTGSYLEQLTGQMNATSVFESITYLNESKEWISFDLHQIKRFFLLEMKCFRVNIDQDYNRNQFHFSDNTQVLRVNFKKIERGRLIHFMTQSRETAEFSKILNLETRYKYVITHKAFLYEHEDRFGFLRRHFPPLPEGDVGDLRGQLLELQANEPQRRTLSLPVEEEHFGVEVDEDRFEQLHSLQMKSQNKRTNLNYRQMFVTNHLRYDGKLESDFNFQLVFLRRVMHFTNEVNYATLTLALLNLLSLWLELGVLDMRPFLVRIHDHFLVYLYLHFPLLLLRKFVKTMLSFCSWLKKLELKLYDLIDHQPAHSLAQARRAQSAPVSCQFPRPTRRPLPASACLTPRLT